MKFPKKFSKKFEQIFCIIFEKFYRKFRRIFVEISKKCFNDYRKYAINLVSIPRISEKLKKYIKIGISQKLEKVYQQFREISF